jgi:hypothetical protein
LIVSLSSGTGGAYPVAELRMSSYKNTRICYVPDHVILRQVETLLQSPSESAEDAAVQARLRYSLSVLKEYAKAFRSIRAAGVLNFKDFPYGA